ncbi:MAG TPA: septum formation initiator family protein [Chitinophagaceae bacterium]|jgi:cell division protein FtsB|nr:septum formation initiator family protein [Chitinophagaceae bacterium]
MSTFAKILRIAGNKYVIAITVFAVLMLFVDRNNIFEQRQRKLQLNDLLASKKFYQDEIDKLKKNLADLKNNPAALEKYARENYLMKKSNEDLFIVDSTAAEAKK